MSNSRPRSSRSFPTINLFVAALLNISLVRNVIDPTRSLAGISYAPLQLSGRIAYFSLSCAFIGRHAHGSFYRLIRTFCTRIVPPRVRKYIALLHHKLDAVVSSSTQLSSLTGRKSELYSTAVARWGLIDDQRGKEGRLGRGRHPVGRWGNVSLNVGAVCCEPLNSLCAPGKLIR